MSHGVYFILLRIGFGGLVVLLWLVTSRDHPSTFPDRLVFLKFLIPMLPLAEARKWRREEGRGTTSSTSSSGSSTTFLKSGSEWIWERRDWE